MKFLRADIRTGGSTLFLITDGKAVTMYGRASYVQIDTPHRVIYTQQFCDENEVVSRHPLASTWPETILTTVILSEEEPGMTRVTVASEPFGATTAPELDALVKSRSGMTQGWTGAFDKLESILAQENEQNM